MDVEYDEFGNPIGAPQSVEYASDDAERSQVGQHQDLSMVDIDDDYYGQQNNIDTIQHRNVNQEEDYEQVRMDEDTQPITQPIIEPLTELKFELRDSQVPQYRYSMDYMQQLLSNPVNIRNVCLIGPLHSGKTALATMLINSCMFLQQVNQNLQNHVNGMPFIDIHSDSRKEHPTLSRYLDNLLMERSRRISLDAHPITLMLQSYKRDGKRYAVNLMDTPGHPDFMALLPGCALPLSECAVLVLDVCEGVTLSAEKQIEACLQSNVRLVLCVNKLDRLILELRLPPADAYHKIRHCIEQVNLVIRDYFKEKGDSGVFVVDSMWEQYRVSPELNNVLFASAQYGFMFTLSSFASIYATRCWQKVAKNLNLEEFTRRLWGDLYYNQESRKFTRQQRIEGQGKKLERSFVNFILNPLYKVFSNTLVAERKQQLNRIVTDGLKMAQKDVKFQTLEGNARPQLSKILQAFFGDSSVGAFTDLVVDISPSPIQESAILRQQSLIAVDSILPVVSSSNTDGPLIIRIAKHITNQDGKSFSLFGRVISGKLTAGARLLYMDDFDSNSGVLTTVTVQNVWLYQTRHRIPVKSLGVGSWALFDVVTMKQSSSTTFNAKYNLLLGSSKLLGDLLDSNQNSSINFNHNTVNSTNSVMSYWKICIEPLVASELPQMIEALKLLQKKYPALVVQVEESGEHALLGTGELYMDCVMSDLRNVFGQIEVRVSDPMVVFREGIEDKSPLKCVAESLNKKNRIFITAEPMSAQLAQDLHDGRIDLSMKNKKQLRKLLENKYGWDKLMSRNIIAFGPDNGRPTNVLINDTIPEDVDQELLLSVINDLKLGFQWACREGPLCEEPLHGIVFKLIDLQLAPESADDRNSNQIVPAMRRAVYTALLLSTPKLMEPMYQVEVQLPHDALPVVYTLLKRRRGQISREMPIAGSPLYQVRATLPIIDSFGFEVDLRSQTRGEAFVQMLFSYWQPVPGDPLDTSVVIKPMEASPVQYLARDFMLKTRRRKALSEDVSIAQYFDDAMLTEIAKQDS
ncbi:hypothetical protein MP228_008556 [Amoeboaphelidium protococcarum]|nr:hypothetical protein MP228_008556 [Amoeboaphelidium protococcarum]